MKYVTLRWFTAEEAPSKKQQPSTKALCPYCYCGEIVYAEEQGVFHCTQCKKAIPLTTSDGVLMQTKVMKNFETNPK